MMHTHSGWQTIVSKDGKLLTYMAIFTPVGDDNWEENVAYVQAIDDLARQYKLQDVADISVNARVLTVAFHLPEHHTVPDVVKVAGEAVSARLVA